MNCKRHKNLGYKPERCDDCNEIDRPVSKSASVPGSKACVRPAEDYGDKELIDLALEIHARACVYQTPALHDRAIEARTELLRRLRDKP